MSHAFSVEVPEEGITFEVAAHQTMVVAAAEAGIEIQTACENGECGTCVVKVLEGEVDHRDRALKPEKHAEGWMCACVSRASGEKLVVELW